MFDICIRLTHISKCIIQWRKSWQRCIRWDCWWWWWREWDWCQNPWWFSEESMQYFRYTGNNLEVSRVFWWGRSFKCRVRNEYKWCVSMVFNLWYVQLYELTNAFLYMMCLSIVNQLRQNLRQHLKQAMWIKKGWWRSITQRRTRSRRMQRRIRIWNFVMTLL